MLIPLFYDPDSKYYVHLEEKDGANKAIAGEEAQSQLNYRDFRRDLVPWAKRRSLVLDSTRSGSSIRSKDSSVYGRILEPILKNVLKVPHEYFGTTSASSILEFANSLSDISDPLCIVIISGDTSINELLNSLQGTKLDILFYVIPAGTGNALALSLNIENETDALLRFILGTEDDVHDLQVYEAIMPPETKKLQPDGSQERLSNSSVLFTVVFSWAFHASLVADSDTEEMRKLGIERFKKAAHDNLERPQVYHGLVALTNKGTESWSNLGPFAYLTVTPAQRFEPTFQILPQGNILDDRLFLVAFNSKDDPSYILDIMNEVYDSGKHVHNSEVIYRPVEPGTSLRLAISPQNTPSDLRFCIDGAIFVLPDSQAIREIIVQHRACSHEKYRWRIAGNAS